MSSNEMQQLAHLMRRAGFGATQQELEVEVRGRRINSQLESLHGSSKTPPYFRAISEKN